MCIQFDLDVEDISIEDNLMDLFIDQLHDFAEKYEEDGSPIATEWSSSSVE
tara:strand:+ start:3017 stop:3169 length:153 start_codon:yes stop_codon:yes gene_type:complete